MAFQRPFLPASGRLPDFHGLVIARRSEVSAVGAVSHRSNPTVMSAEGREWEVLSRHRVPNSYARNGATSHPLTIGTEGHAGDLTVGFQREHLLPVGRVPHRDDFSRAC